VETSTRSTRNPVSELIGSCTGDDVAQLRRRVEHLERLTLAQAIENEQLADENERLRAANETLAAPRGIRATLSRSFRN
jgi:hypothetical protein